MTPQLLTFVCIDGVTQVEPFSPWVTRNLVGLTTQMPSAAVLAGTLVADALLAFGFALFAVLLHLYPLLRLMVTCAAIGLISRRRRRRSATPRL